VRTKSIALVLSIAAASTAPAPATDAQSVFLLHFLGHEIGRETSTRVAKGQGERVESTFHYDDRGAAVDLTASLETGPNLTPVQLTVKGKTYRYFSADTDVSIDKDHARVRDGSKTTDVALTGTPFFPIDGYAPFGVQEQLIRYWFTHGQPAEIVAPPAGVVRIARRAQTGDEWRLAIGGVVWGIETAWYDAKSSELRGLTTWAGALPFEAVREGSERLRDRYFTEATKDRIADLEALTKKGPAPIASGPYAIVGATVADGTGRPAIDNATVLVRDGRIEAVGPAASVRPTRGVTLVDGKGKTIVPGLWDMHAHASQVDWAPVYLASGVTTIRDMGGEQGFLVAFRNAIDSGRAFGPRMLLAGLVDGPGSRAFGTVWAATPDEGRQVARRYKADGFQEIKIYSLVAPDVVEAIAEEAHALGLMVTGHVPNGMNARSAVEAGFDQIAHMPINGQPGSPAVKELIQFFVEHKTAIDPTQSWGEFLQHPVATPIEAFQPGVTRLPPVLARMIRSTPGGNAEPAAARARLLQSLQNVRDAQRAGVPVVAGTDKGVPGFSVQREIELYVDGGMTPLEALQAATIVPARVMRLERETGTIEAGKRADLLVLDGNPLENIANIRRGVWVVANGKIYDCAALWRAAGYRAD
jgi:imidazolonepropionase-like amidohydrolase